MTATYRMRWPVTDIHTPLAALLATAEHDLAIALNGSGLDRADTPEWTFSWVRGRLHLTCELPVIPEGWAPREVSTRPASVPTLRPHGTHAAYMRHKARGSDPCQECVEGEREYQRLRHLRRRAERLQVAS